MSTQNTLSEIERLLEYFRDIYVKNILGRFMFGIFYQYIQGYFRYILEIFMLGIFFGKKHNVNVHRCHITY